MEHEGDGNTNCNCCTGNNPSRIDTETGRFGNKRTSEDHPDNSIDEIGKNTENSPGDLRKLVVTQTPVGNHQLTLVLYLSKK